MEKTQSLADFLGVDDPQQPDRTITVAPSPKLKAKDFCKSILDTPQYRESLLRRIILDELPPAVECLLYHYAHGKPVEHVEVKDVTDPLEDFTPEQCEERAMRLLEVARQLRAADAPDDAPDNAHASRAVD